MSVTGAGGLKFNQFGGELELVGKSLSRKKAEASHLRSKIARIGHEGESTAPPRSLHSSSSRPSILQPRNLSRLVLKPELAIQNP
jgi:hypothetical protein